MSYAGSSLHNLMYRCFRSPYDHSVANFFVSAFLEIGIMCIDGRSLRTAYGDLRPENISTLRNPYLHIPGQRVPCVVCDAETVFLGEYTRPVFDGVCDNMIADFALQFEMARDESWKFMAGSIYMFFHNFFKVHGSVEMDVVRSSFINRVKLLWRAVSTTVLGPYAIPPQIVPVPASA